MTNSDKAMDIVISDIRKRFGETAIMRLGETTTLDIEAIPTGCLSLDIALGIGGFPRGRIVEIYGPESSGKTTICQHVIAEAQAMGGKAAFVDVEHALDPSYAAKCGVDIDELFVSQPDTGEQALDITEALVRSGAVDVVVVDSVAALVPRAEIEGEMGDSHMGLQARLMSQAMRKLTGAVKSSNTLVIFTNQLRQKIGILFGSPETTTGGMALRFYASVRLDIRRIQAIKTSNTVVIFTNQLRQKIGVMFGNPETTTGGMALRFYASVRLDIRRIQAIKNQGDVIGNRTKVTVKKNKVAPPFKVVEFDIMYNQGVSKSGDLLDLAVEYGIVQKAGSFYSYDDLRLAQGRENSKQVLEDTPELMKDIESKVREHAQI